MKRFSIGAMRLYYPSLEEAQKNNPNDIVSECTDEEHTPFVEAIKQSLEFIGEAQHDSRSCRELYRGANPCESVEVMLFRDPSDGMYYDYLRFRRQPKGSLIVHVLWDVSTPKKFCDTYLTLHPLRYRSMASFKKLPKPKELKGLSSFCSVTCHEPYHGEGKTTNQHFRKDNDLWIKSPHYFDLFTSDSNGTHYYVRNAWCVFENFFEVMNIYTPHQMAKICADEVSRYHQFGEPLNNDSSRYLERMCNKIYELMREDKIEVPA